MSRHGHTFALHHDGDCDPVACPWCEPREGEE